VALTSNTTGVSNTAIGSGALHGNTTASHNTATGYISLYNNTTGSFNTATGDRALYSNTTGTQNTANGYQALNNNTATGNTAVGYQAALGNTSAFGKTAVGFQAALIGNGSYNTAVGYQADMNSNSISNDAFGYQALQSVTTGTFNVGIGAAALHVLVSGSENTALGNGAGQFITGSSNVVLGELAGNAVTTAGNVICIGALLSGANVNNSCYIGSIFGQTSSGGTAVFINSAGQLGTTTSSRRFKDEIKPMDKASEALFALKPVTFFYKKEIEPQRIPQFGLVAEDVEKINPDLVVRDAEGKVNTVRYEAVNAMLLNEFLKEHCKMQKLEATIAKQQKQIEALTTGLQKVSDQLELSKPARQTVVNNQ
jgi:hypothetical protein